MTANIHGSCPHLSSTQCSFPTASSAIYKEECTLCFDGLDSLGGVDVCLTCFNGSCTTTPTSSHPSHSALHFTKTKHALVLNFRRVLKEAHELPPPKKLTKVEINAGDLEQEDEQKYHLITALKCLACDGGKELDKSHMRIFVDALIAAVSAKKQSQVQAWREEITTCSHISNLKQEGNNKIQPNAQCSACDLRENLWMCLTCGNVACGRQQFGGVGGNGHALAHFEATNHPVAVKLGSITAEGTGDVFCYADGEDRVDPSFSAHVAYFGIDVATREKTEKSLAELQLEQNMKFDFSMTTNDGQELVPIYGPALTGISNLGNTCYMASAIQAIVQMPWFKLIYLEASQSHIEECRLNSAACLQCQLHKLADGLLSGRYSYPAVEGDLTSGQRGVSPSMFKALIGKGHPEFSTMRQQDAMEFLMFLLDRIQQLEKKMDVPVNSYAQFEFYTEKKLRCSKCKGVRFHPLEEAANLTLPIPIGKENAVTLNDCASLYFSSSSESFECPVDQMKCECEWSVGLKNCPEILVVSLSRFVIGKNYVIEKWNGDVQIPLCWDLSSFKAEGKLASDLELPEDEAGHKSGSSVNMEALQNLAAMGFSENRCKRALLATGNEDAELAMQWIFENMDTPGVDDELPAASSQKWTSAFNQEHIANLCDMGFTANQAKKALLAVSGSLEHAVDYLFSNTVDDSPPPSTEGASLSTKSFKESSSWVYELQSFISHKGTSAHCGHYVASARSETGDWIMFNDNRVVRMPQAQNIGQGSIFIYKRK